MAAIPSSDPAFIYVRKAPPPSAYNNVLCNAQRLPLHAPPRADVSLPTAYHRAVVDVTFSKERPSVSYGFYVLLCTIRLGEYYNTRPESRNTIAEELEGR